MNSYLELFKAGATVFGGTLLGIVMQLWPFVWALLLLIVLDLYTGIRAAQKEKRFSSKGMRQSVRKFIEYTALLFAVGAVQMAFLPQVPIIYGAALYLCSVELISIDENFQVLHGISFWKFIKTYFPKNIQRFKK